MRNRFPWYDSRWLSTYVDAKSHIARHHPNRLNEFADAFAPLRTRPDFEVEKVNRVFDDGTMDRVREAVRTLDFTTLELHEASLMGRVIVHNNPVFTELQRLITPLVSDLAGEPVETFYNFLSLYSTLGVCPIHMDAPEAKWTLDLCIEQSVPWPIHFSDVVPWPEDLDAGGMGYEEWQTQIRKSGDVKFHSFTLQPGEALFFSGSSQWHYRDPIPDAAGSNFCNLLFFHFIPAGMKPVLRPENWASMFGIPDLDVIVDAAYASERL